MADRNVREVFEELGRSVRSVLVSRFPGLSVPEREDIEQDVRLKLWKILASGKKIRNFRSYAWRVVFTTALDLIDERGRWTPLDDDRDRAREDVGDTAPSPADAWETRELQRRVREAVDGLAPRRRTVLRMHLDGRDLDETARALGWSRHQVRHLLYRGIDDLRRRMAGRPPAGETRPREGP